MENIIEMTAMVQSIKEKGFALRKELEELVKSTREEPGCRKFMVFSAVTIRIITYYGRYLRAKWPSRTICKKNPDYPLSSAVKTVDYNYSVRK
jgi:hypothetical protein